MLTTKFASALAFYRQAVLANVRGTGESIFEFYFLSGSKIMGEITSGLRAGERDGV